MPPGQAHIHFSNGPSGPACQLKGTKGALCPEGAEQLPLGCRGSHGRLSSPWPHGETGPICSRVSLWALFHLTESHNGRLPGRVGVQEGPRAVVCRRPRCTCQCAGDESSSPGPATFCTAPKGQICPGTVRQHVHCASYKPSRWDKICAAAGNNERPPYMGCHSSSQPSGNELTRGVELLGRLPLPAETSSGRVAPPYELFGIFSAE